MEQSHIANSDELSLRDLIQILFIGKTLIVWITLAALVLGVLAAFFLIPQSYETTATIIANPITMSSPEQSTGLVDDLTQLPNVNVSTYLYQIVGNEVLGQVITANQLKFENGKLLSIQSLKQMITINNPKDTNLIEITVKHQSPEQAAQIANAICTTFVDYINTNSRTTSENAARMIEQQLSVETENLKVKSDALTVYRQNSPDIDILRGEVASIISQINSNNQRLNSLSSAIPIDEKTLATLLKTHENLKYQSSSDFQLSFEFDQETGSNSVNLNPQAENLSDSLAIIELNKIQSRLIYNDNTRVILQANNDALKEKLAEKQIQLTEEEYRFDTLNRDLELAKATYNAYQQRHKEAVLASVADLGITKILITSEAFIPEAPTGTSKLSILAISAVLGLMLGCALVLFRHYWSNN